MSLAADLPLAMEFAQEVQTKMRALHKAVQPGPNHLETIARMAKRIEELRDTLLRWVGIGIGFGQLTALMPEGAEAFRATVGHLRIGEEDWPDDPLHREMRDRLSSLEAAMTKSFETVPSKG